MKNLRKAFSVLALSGALVVPAIADDTTTAPTSDAGPAPAAAAPTTDAKDQKDLKKVIEDQGINYVETAQKGITLSGYVDASYTEQFAGRGQYGPAGFNYGGGPGNTQSALRQFDTSNNTFNINAVKIALEKALPDKNEWAAGFRVDTIYGSDAAYLGDTAFNGNTIKGTGTVNDSGLAIEQALVKFRIPVGNGLDIYAGKFVTFLGYEVIESPANLNFSRGLLFTNLIPLTNTGVYADYKFNDTFEAKLAVVDGWNNSTSPSVSSFAPRANENGFGKAIMGQLNINAPGKNANVTQSFIYSPEGEPGAVGVDNGPVVVYDIWGNWNPTFVKDSALLLGFNVDLGYNGASGSPGGTSTTTGVDPEEDADVTTTTTTAAVKDSNTWVGIALYAQYKFSKVFSLAGRAEYIHEDSAINPKFGEAGAAASTTSTTLTEIGGPGVLGPITTAANGTSYAPDQNDFSYTLTASFNIWDNLLTRVEYRIDDFSAGSNVFKAGRSSVQNEISAEAVYSF